MTKSILQTLSDDVHYPVGEGFLENRLLSRGLDGSKTADKDTINGNDYKGALADTLMSLATAPSFSEGGVNISLSDKDKIISIANKIFKEIGEPQNVVDDQEPTCKFM